MHFIQQCLEQMMWQKMIPETNTLLFKLEGRKTENPRNSNGTRGGARGEEASGVPVWVSLVSCWDSVQQAKAPNAEGNAKLRGHWNNHICFWLLDIYLNFLPSTKATNQCWYGIKASRTGMSRWNTYHKCAKNITWLDNI